MFILRELIYAYLHQTLWLRKLLILVFSEDLETKRVTRLNEESTFISQNICKDDIGDVHGESIEKRLLHIKMLNMERESLRALGTHELHVPNLTSFRI